MLLLPRARVRGRCSFLHDGWDWLVSSPPWARSLFGWALSGAFVAGVGNLLAVLMRNRQLFELTMIGSVSIACVAALGMFFLVWPFWISGWIYLGLRPLGTPASSVAWCVGFHSAAHMLTMMAVGASPFVAIEVPLVVAGLWGLWLPATFVHDPR